MLRIRPTKDIALVEKLHEQCFPGDEFENSKKTVWWVAWQDEAPVGFCSCKSLGEDMCYLTRAGVCEEANGKGIQRKLIAVRERWAKRQGLGIVITYTAKDNWPSIVNLIKCGYKAYEPQWAWAGRAFVYWKKRVK